jgi:hypothetical protein
MEDLRPKNIKIIINELIQDSLEENREILLECDGVCMHPLLRTGDAVFLKKTKNLKFADLAVYKKNGGFISHRFIRKVKSKGKVLFIFKADNSWDCDQPVAEEQVLGAVIRLKRKDGIVILNTFSGRLKNLKDFAVSYFRLFFPRLGSVITIKEFYDPAQERRALKLIAKDDLNDEESAELISLMSNKLNWEYLSERFKWNLLSPFFVNKMAKYRLNQFVPQDYKEKLENLAKLQLVRDTKFRRGLDDALFELNKNKIDVIVLKGAHLGLEVYDDTHNRWMGDIDLMVRYLDWQRTHALLTALGFKADGERINYDSWGLKFLDNHINFLKDGMKVELKSNVWALSFPYFDCSLWDSAKEFSINNKKAFIPSREETLLLACINLYRHNFSGLIWFLDIKKIVQGYKDNFDWQRFHNLADKYDLNVIAYFSLYYVDKIFGLGLNTDILADLKPGYLSRKLFKLFWDEKAILLEKEGQVFRTKIPFELSLVLFGGKLSLRPIKLKKYFAYLIGIIFPPKSYLMNRYSLGDNYWQFLGCYINRGIIFTKAFFNCGLKLINKGSSKKEYL